MYKSYIDEKISFLALVLCILFSREREKDGHMVTKNGVIINFSLFFSVTFLTFRSMYLLIYVDKYVTLRFFSVSFTNMSACVNNNDVCILQYYINKEETDKIVFLLVFVYKKD
jgi:hypothetical protein